MILVDANVLIDVIFDQQPWFEWSKKMLEQAGENDRLAINDIVFAEVSHNFGNAQSVSFTLARLGMERCPMTEGALFAASRAFLDYRRRGGQRMSILPDFFIGAQAQAEGWTLLTRDAGRYRTYFPEVRLIAPDAP